MSQKSEFNEQSKMGLSHRTYVENLLKHYQENDIQQGDPNEGVWHQAHYPQPKHLGGQTVVLLLPEHHAVQGVLQSEEYQSCCVYGWEKKYLTGYLLERFYHWKSIQCRAAGKLGPPVCRERGIGIFNKSDPRIIAGALKGSRSPASEKQKREAKKVGMNNAKPILIIRLSDGHVFFFNSTKEATESSLGLKTAGLVRNKDKGTSYKGHIIESFN